MTSLILRFTLQIAVFLAATFVFMVLLEFGAADFPAHARTEWEGLVAFVLG